MVGSMTDSPSWTWRTASTSVDAGENPLLQEVPDSLGMGVQETHRIGGLDVLRQHEHGDVGMLIADALRRPAPHRCGSEAS